MTKRQIYITYFVLALIVGLSVFFCLKYKWWGLLLPFAVLLSYKPMWRYLLALFKKKPETVKEQPITSNIIDSIKVLTLKDFITICIDQDLTVLGDGTHKQLQEAYGKILSEYYDVRADEQMRQRLKLARQIKDLELRKVIVALIADALKARYSIAAVNTLRTIYPMYKFTKETYLDDLYGVGNHEIGNGIKLERLIDQLNKMDLASGEERKMNSIQKHASFTQRLADINKNEGGASYDLKITVLEYAVLESRLDAHIESLKEQARKNKQ